MWRAVSNSCWAMQSPGSRDRNSWTYIILGPWYMGALLLYTVDFATTTSYDAEQYRSSHSASFRICILSLGKRCLCLWRWKYPLVRSPPLPQIHLDLNGFFRFAYMEGRAFRHGDIVCQSVFPDSDPYLSRPPGRCSCRTYQARRRRRFCACVYAFERAQI